MIQKLLSVFLFGMIGLWEGIPVGFALRLPAVVIAVVSALGSATATLLVAFLGERLQQRLLRRAPAGPGEPGERFIDRVFRRYGTVGLGLLAPCLTGAPVGVALGLVFKVPPRPLLFWLLVGIAVWSALLTATGAAGVAGVRRLFTG